MSIVDRGWVLSGLREATERLASAAPVQVDWLQGGRIHPDELALEFDQFLLAALSNFSSEFGIDALQRLRALDNHLASMSGSSNAPLWSEAGIRSAPEWVQVRDLATAALALNGWPSA